MGAIATAVPCIEPTVAATGGPALSITFNTPLLNPIPFRTQAVDCTTGDPLDEPGYDPLTSAMHTYPYDLTGLGGGATSGYALCLDRGRPGPAGRPYGQIDENDIAPGEPRLQRAVRFVLGNIPESPNNNWSDADFQRVRRVILAGYDMVANGELSEQLYGDDGMPYTGPFTGDWKNATAFIGPYNGWEAYGLAQVAIWLILNQVPIYGCIKFLDGNGHDPGPAERARLFNAYVVLKAMALEWADGDFDCAALGDCNLANLAIEAENGTSFEEKGEGTQANCRPKQITVGPFEIVSCCAVWPAPSIDAPGVTDAVFIGGADGNTVITPGCGGRFWVRLTPPSRSYTFRIRARAEVATSRVYYFRYTGPPPPRQNMGFVRKTRSAVNAELPVTVRFTCEPVPPPPPRLPPVIIRPPPPPPRPPVITTDNNNNNNNSDDSNNNNSSNNNMQHLQSVVLNALLNNAQAIAVLRGYYAGLGLMGGTGFTGSPGFGPGFCGPGPGFAGGPGFPQGPGFGPGPMGPPGCAGYHDMPFGMCGPCCI